MSRRPLPNIEGATELLTGLDSVPGALTTEDPAAEPAAGGELVDVIGAAPVPAATEPAATPAGVDEDAPAVVEPAAEAVVEPVAEAPKQKKTGAPKKAAQAAAQATPAPRTRTTPARRQGATGGRTGAAEAASPGAVTAAAAVSPAPAVPGPGYAERGEALAYRPAPGATVPPRLLDGPRRQLLRWVRLMERANAVMAGDVAAACDEYRAVCELHGIDAADAEAALLAMGASVNAPIPAPLPAPADTGNGAAAAPPA